MNIKDFITEGIFNVNHEQMGANMFGSWLKNNTKGDFKLKTNANGTVDITGNILFKNTEFIGSMNIGKVSGTITFKKCADLVDFKKIFTEFGSIKRLVIVDCENFESFEGCPVKIDSVEVTGCPKFRSLDTLPKFADKVTIANCGKRFKKEQIKKQCEHARIIMCSEEDYADMVTEAFKDPVLAKVWDDVRTSASKTSRGTTLKMHELFPNDWKISEIAPSDREEYDLHDAKEDDWVRAAQKLLRGGQYQIYGLIVGYDSKKDKVKFVVKKDWEGWKTIFFGPQRDSSWGKESGLENFSHKVSEISDWFSKDNLINRRGIDTLYIYRNDIHDKEEVENRYKITKARQDSREGMIKLDKWSLADLADRQRKNYRQAAAKLKHLKQTDEYKDLANKIEKIMNRITNMTAKMLRDMQWARDNRWRINTILEKYGQWPHSTGQGRDKKWVDGGFLYKVKEFASHIADIAKGDAYDWQLRDKDVKYKSIVKSIDEFDKDLKSIGC